MSETINQTNQDAPETLPLAAENPTPPEQTEGSVNGEDPGTDREDQADQTDPMTEPGDQADQTDPMTEPGDQAEPELDPAEPVDQTDPAIDPVDQTDPTIDPADQQDPATDPATGGSTSDATAGGRLERARATRKLLRHDAQALDDDALDALGAESFFDSWGKGVRFAVGEIVAYQGRLYRAILAHKGREDWPPSASPTLFHPLRAASAPLEDAPDWVKPQSLRNGYNTGAEVRYQGQIWRSTVNFNTRAPGEVPGQWALKVH